MKNRTYRYASQELLFPFGFGLSYTKFKYDNARTSATTFSKNNKIIQENIAKKNENNVAKIFGGERSKRL